MKARAAEIDIWFFTHQVFLNTFLIILVGEIVCPTLS